MSDDIIQRIAEMVDGQREMGVQPDTAYVPMSVYKEIMQSSSMSLNAFYTPSEYGEFRIFGVDIVVDMDRDSVLVLDTTHEGWPKP